MSWFTLTTVEPDSYLVIPLAACEYLTRGIWNADVRILTTCKSYVYNLRTWHMELQHELHDFVMLCRRNSCLYEKARQTPTLASSSASSLYVPPRSAPSPRVVTSLCMSGLSSFTGSALLSALPLLSPAAEARWLVI